jgi:hypothetical protein
MGSRIMQTQEEFERQQHVKACVSCRYFKAGEYWGHSLYGDDVCTVHGEECPNGYSKPYWKEHELP